VVQVPLNVISRASRLARTQTGEAIAVINQRYPDWVFRFLTLDTPGDRDLHTPLTDAAVPDDFFTRDLDHALLEKSADLAVHSAKDLPQQLHPDLTVVALLPALDIRDALVFTSGWNPANKPATIGTSSPRRDEVIRAMYPQAERLPLRGTIDQRIERLDAGAFDAIIVAACALERLQLRERIGAYLPCDPAPQQGRLALVIRKEDAALYQALRELDVRRTAGLVAIVGCPADSALLSSRARRYLDRADVVIHDRLIPEDVLAVVRHKAIPVGKTGGEPSTPQSDIHRMMLHEAEKGRLVVRLQGGDPGIFGHMSGQLEFLSAWNLRTDIVPALTAAQVASSRANAPLTHRGDGGHVHLLSGHTPRGATPEPLPGPGHGNLAVYMGVTEAPEMARRLRAAGWPAGTPVVVAERLGYRDERIQTATVAELEALTISKPAVFLVGVHTYPVSKRTLFVGTDPDHFLNHGPLIHWPLIQLQSKALPDRVQLLTQYLPDCAGVIFPSRHAVTAFMEALLAKDDARSLKGKTLLAVGPATAEALVERGLRADAAVDSFGGVQALAKEIGNSISGRFLYPCSDVSPTQDRSLALAKHGIDLCPACFYENRAIQPDEPLPGNFQRVLFTSSSTVKAYFDLYPEEYGRRREWLAVGPSTLKSLHERGLAADMLQAPADRVSDATHSR